MSNPTPELEALRARAVRNGEHVAALEDTLRDIRREGRQIAADLLRVEYGLDVDRLYYLTMTFGFGAAAQQRRIVVGLNAALMGGNLRVKVEQHNSEGRPSNRFYSLRDDDLRALEPCDVPRQGRGAAHGEGGAGS